MIENYAIYYDFVLHFRTGIPEMVNNGENIRKCLCSGREIILQIIRIKNLQISNYFLPKYFK